MTVVAGERTETLVRMFRSRCDQTPEAPAARTKQDGVWRDTTWAELEERVIRVANALIAAGIRPGDRVCLMGDTRLEWVVIDLGIQCTGAVTVPIYPSNLPDDCRHIADNSEAVLVFVDTPKQAAKFVSIRDRLPHVRTVVQYMGDIADDADGWLRPLDSLWPKGDQLATDKPAAVDAAIANVKPGDLSTIIYTSGTTGRPKGVMLSHDAFVFVSGAVEEIGLATQDDVQLFFLPLAHSFAQAIKSVWIRTGHVMAFAESIDKLVDNLKEVQPTVLAAVPRIFEKIYNKVVTDGSAMPEPRGALFRRTLTEIDHFAQANDAGQEYRSLSLSAVKRLVLPAVHDKLMALFGGRLRFFFSGGAPLSRKIAWFFNFANIQILEGYGLTETSAGTCMNRLKRNKIGTVGPPVPGMEIRTAGDGEVLIRGRGVMRGYFGNSEATAECIDTDGWFHSGDIGVLDEDGYLKITDRKKDIIVTAGGKNIAPQNLENALKANAIVSQVLVHGDRRPYLVALVTVSEERARSIAAAAGVTAVDYAELSRVPSVRDSVQTVFDALNATLPSYETIKKFEILPRDFSQDAGELTPTLKVKRRVCEERYGDLLEGMYPGKAIGAAA